MDVRSLVDCLPVDLDPCMGLERELLCSEDHVCWHTVFSEKIRSDEGALQAKRLFWIPDAGVVDRHADTVDGVLTRRRVGDGPALDHRINGLEATEGTQNVIGK